MLHLLLEVVGAAIALVAVAVVWSVMLIAAGRDAKAIIQHYIQIRRDTRLFKNIEEFRRDFA